MTIKSVKKTKLRSKNQSGSGLYDLMRTRKYTNIGTKTLKSKGLLRKLSFGAIGKRGSYDKLKTMGNDLKIISKGQDGKKMVTKLTMEGNTKTQMTSIMAKLKDKKLKKEGKQQYKMLIDKIKADAEKVKIGETATHGTTGFKSITQYGKKPMFSIGRGSHGRKITDRTTFKQTDGTPLINTVTKRDNSGIRTVSKYTYNPKGLQTKVSTEISNRNKNWLSKKLGVGDRTVTSKFNDKGRLSKVTRSRGPFRRSEDTRLYYEDGATNIGSISIKRRGPFGKKSEITKYATNVDKAEFIEKNKMGTNTTQMFAQNRQFNRTSAKLKDKFGKPVNSSSLRPIKQTTPATQPATQPAASPTPAAQPPQPPQPPQSPPQPPQSKTGSATNVSLATETSTSNKSSLVELLNFSNT
jgi:hypothetical protein